MLLSGRVVVNCNSTHMGFHVAKALLRPFVVQQFLHLNDATCRVQEDLEFFFLTWRLDECGNELNFTVNDTYVRPCLLFSCCVLCLKALLEASEVAFGFL